MCAINGAVVKEYDPEAVDAIVTGLSMTNHRGREAAGIAYSNGQHIWHHKKFGTVSQVFTDRVVEDMKRRKARMFAGQTLYSTSIGRSTRNIPPQYLDTLPKGKYALVHNGNLFNLDEKKREFKLKAGNRICFSEDDIEVVNDTEFMLKHLLWLIELYDLNELAAIEKFIEITRGSYSAALIYKDAIHLFRDPWGNRPLFYVNNDKGTFFSSEDCTLEYMGCERIHQVEPGQVITISKDGSIDNITTVKRLENYAHCIFENVYFARPDSHVFTKNFPISEFRRRLGKELARLSSVANADFVTDIPDSGKYAAQGFGLEAKIPFLSAYVKDGEVGRTFINPSVEARRKLTKIKCRLDRYLVQDKVVVLVDDSIVRGNTIEGRVEEMKMAGAKEVHVRSSFPLITSQCFYGMDFPTKEELIGANMDIESMRQKLGADSLYFQSIESIEKVINECGSRPSDFCKACCDGNYPIPISGP